MFVETYDNRGKKRGWIEVICGSMFSGKTEELIRRLKRAEIAKQKVEIFKPLVDTRYDEEEVVSHDQNTIKSTPVPHSSQLLFLANEVEVVGIDEAQFFDDGLPHVCNQLANSGVRVIIAGLDMDYLGRPFGPMPHLLAIAEFVTKVHAICVETGNLANFSHRYGEGEKLVQLGEKEQYAPLSREAFAQALTGKPEGNFFIHGSEHGMPEMESDDGDVGVVSTTPHEDTGDEGDGAVNTTPKEENSNQGNDGVVSTTPGEKSKEES